MPSYRSLASSTVVINPGNEDRISQLSDDVLCSILSYLTTKEVVATSVLSKRWKYVWASSQELTIESGCNRSLSHLICRLFACRTLVKLIIKGRFVVDIPTSAACTTFPCLKILSLEGVVYSNHISAQKLFSSCHVLEDLTICRHKCDGLRVLIICVPPLKRLAITSSIRGGDNLKVKIDCPCVQYFEFHGKSEIKFIANLSSLVEAHIYGKCGFDLFKKISHVEFLALSDKAVRGLSWSNPKNFLLTFNELVKLELLGDYFYWKSLPQLLERSPNLEVLVFPKGFVVLRDIWYGYPGFYWNEPNSVPQCLISHLKKIRIQNFVGLPDEIQFLKYVLKFGEALETVEIRCANVDEKWLMMKADEGLKNVARCEKASRSCSIVVHFPN